MTPLLLLLLLLLFLLLPLADAACRPSSSSTYSSPLALPKSAMCFLTPVSGFLLTTAVICSWIFSHTRGTPRNSVGSTARRRSPSVPLPKSYGLAQCTCTQPFVLAAPTMGHTMSIIIPATWDSGRYDTSRSSCGPSSHTPHLRVSSTLQVSNTRLSCEIITALGRPVVPDV
jgi:hypothetical protein